MEIKYNVTGEERKRLVGAIAEITGEESEYLRYPVNAYRIGDSYTVDSIGTLIFKEEGNGGKFEDLVETLKDKGFTAIVEDNKANETGDNADSDADEAEASSGDSEAEEVPDNTEDDASTDSAGSASEEEAQAEALAKDTEDSEGDNVDYGDNNDNDNDNDNDDDILVIDVPRDGFPFTAIENLQRLVTSKETLIRQALGVDNLPIALKDDRVSFPWFRGKLDANHVTAYTLFIEKLCKRAKEATRIYGVENPTDNPRFSFRTFLVRLGFVGAEYSLARRILMERLSGSSAWKDGGKPDGSLNDTIKEQLLELKENDELNLFNDSAVQNAACRKGFSELTLFLESHRGKPRMEYARFLLGEAE